MIRPHTAKDGTKTYGVRINRGQGRRYVLIPRGSRYAIQEQLEDRDFDPPMWVEGRVLGRFQTRDEARDFMKERCRRASAIRSNPKATS